MTATTMFFGVGGGATRARAWTRADAELTPERLLAEVGRMAPFYGYDADDASAIEVNTAALDELEVDGCFLAEFLKQGGPARPGSPLPHGSVPNVEALLEETRRLEAIDKRLMNKQWKAEKAKEKAMVAASDPTLETATPSEHRPRSPHRPEGEGIGEAVVDDRIRSLVAEFHSDFIYEPGLPALRRSARQANRADGPANFVGVSVGQRFKIRAGPTIETASAPCGFGSSKNTGRKVMPKSLGPGPGGWGVKPSVFNQYAPIEDKWMYKPLAPIPSTPRDGSVAAKAAAQALMPGPAGTDAAAPAALASEGTAEKPADAEGASPGAARSLNVRSCSSSRFVHPRALAEAQEAARLAALPEGHRSLLQALPEKEQGAGGGAASPRTPAARRALPPGSDGGASSEAGGGATDDRLFAAAMAGNREECLWLLGSYAGDRAVRELLVNYSHPLTAMSPFLYASYHGMAEVVAGLLRPGCGMRGVNDLDGNHRSALHLAARRGHAATCRVLLDCSEFSRVNAPDGDSYHKTALHHAAERGLADVCILLCDHPAFDNVAAKDVTGRTALHYAAIAGLADVCTTLLAHEVFRKSKLANHQDKRFKTAMHYALDGLKDAESGGDARPHHRVRAALLTFSDSPKFWCCEEGQLPPPGGARARPPKKVSKENEERARKVKERIAAREQAMDLLFKPCGKQKKAKKKKRKKKVW